MESVKDLQALVDQIRGGTIPLVEVRVLLHHMSPIVRVNALEALAGAAQNDQGLLEELIAATKNPVNNVPLMGTVSVAHVAVACLLRVGTVAAVEAAKSFLRGLPEPDRTDLIWYLKSEGLQID